MALVSPDPTATFAEALSLFTKSANISFAQVQKLARAEALQSLQAARDERDEALRSVSASQLEVQACKLELGACKASLHQAELTISHQTETIAQLRREITQWKDQSRNWQEHFLRVEQQRCALSSRMDELISHQHSMLALGLSNIPIPTQQDPSSSSSSSSSLSDTGYTTPQAQALPPRPPHKPATSTNTPDEPQSLPTPRSTVKQLKTLNKRDYSSPNPPIANGVLQQSSHSHPHSHPAKPTKTPKKPTYTISTPDVVIPIHSQSEPTQTSTVIRHVQAVINVPIKEEEIDQDQDQIDQQQQQALDDEEILRPGSTMPSSSSSNKRRPSTRRRRVVRDEVDESSDPNDITAIEVNPGNEDEYDPEVDDNYNALSNDEEEDELMLGSTAEQPKRTYHHRRNSLQRSNRDLTLNSTTSRKRKPADAPSRGVATKVRRVPDYTYT